MEGEDDENVESSGRKMLMKNEIEEMDYWLLSNR